MNDPRPKGNKRDSTGKALKIASAFPFYDSGHDVLIGTFINGPDLSLPNMHYVNAMPAVSFKSLYNLVMGNVIKLKNIYAVE